MIRYRTSLINPLPFAGEKKGCGHARVAKKEKSS